MDLLAFGVCGCCFGWGGGFWLFGFGFVAFRVLDMWWVLVGCLGLTVSCGVGII